MESLALVMIWPMITLIEMKVKLMAMNTQVWSLSAIKMEVNGTISLIWTLCWVQKLTNHFLEGIEMIGMTWMDVTMTAMSTKNTDLVITWTTRVLTIERKNLSLLLIQIQFLLNINPVQTFQILTNTIFYHTSAQSMFILNFPGQIIKSHIRISVTNPVIAPVPIHIP
jgi:hypothetical protein